MDRAGRRWKVVQEDGMGSQRKAFNNSLSHDLSPIFYASNTVAASIA